MKIFFITVLVLNLIFEALAGVALIFGDQGILSDLRPAEGMWAMNYGFGALAIASAIIWLWPSRTDAKAVGAVMGMLTTFHVMLTISLAIPGNQTGAMVTHGIFAVMCLVLLLQRHKWCEPAAA